MSYNLVLLVHLPVVMGNHNHSEPTPFSLLIRCPSFLFLLNVFISLTQTQKRTRMNRGQKLIVNE